MIFLSKCKEWFNKIVEEDKRKALEQKKIDISNKSLFLLKKIENKTLACFSYDPINEEEIENLLKEILDEHFFKLVLRPLNYRDDAGSTLEYGIEYDIERRNDKIALVLMKYLDHFKHLILEMDDVKKEHFFNRLKQVQCPRILEQTVLKYEKNLLV